ncbi:MAG: 50S ribosomal protein L25, partial [Chloroflexota bacterium]|nr:50S ribosomal protein L25 [Chloroflexota bacterium]
PRSVQVDARLFERIYHRAGTVHLVDLRMSETGAPTRAFISAVKRHPITHAIAHVDFRVVNLRQETTAHVPIVLTGESPAVADNLGLLQQTLDAITVKVLPTEVPESISVDLSSLTEVGSMIHVKDLVIPAGVTLMTDGEEVVARITAPTLAEVEEPVEAAEGEAAETDATAEGDSSES